MNELGKSDRATTRGDAGFSLVELITVIAIIGLLVAVAIPNLRGYLRTQAIRSAASQLASDIGAARARAISKNLHWGTVIVVLTNTTYRVVTEDDVDKTVNGYTATRMDIPTILANPADEAVQATPVRTLPAGVVFQTTTPVNSGIRFNALGLACNPTVGLLSCPEVGMGANQVAVLPAGDFKVTLYQASTGLYKSVVVAPGGRVSVDPGFAP